MIAIYARQSIDRENSISIDAQIDHCRNIIDTAADTKEYVDRGYSGSNINRPAFEQLLSDIKAGSVTAVYCYRLDRISRNILDFANLQEFFKKYDCSFVSASEHLDTSTPMGRAMINIIMVFAQLERETIAGRIKDSYFARAKLGAYLGGGLPFGYATEKKSFDGKEMSVLVPDPATMHTAKEIFSKYTERRTSILAIVKWLNDKGVTTSKNKPFNATGIRRILRNPLYAAATPDIYDYYLSQGYQIYNAIDDFNGKTGCLIVGKHKNKNVDTDIDQQLLIVSAHEPLIDAETFLSAQYTLAKNKAMKRAGTGHLTWLTGLVRCGQCGYSITTKARNHYIYLACRGHSNLGDGICDHIKHHPVKDIEDYVEKQLFDKIDSLDIDQLVKDTEHKPDIKARQQISKISQQVDKLMDALTEAEGSTAQKHIIKKIEELDAAKAELTASIAPGPNSNVKKMITAAAQIVNHWDTSDVRARNEMASTFIKTIYLTPESTEIEWRI